MAPRPTARGWGLLAAGLASTALGVRIGSPDLVRIGLLAVLSVLAALGWVLAWRLRRGGRSIRVVRDVQPGQLHTGDHAQVEVQVSGASVRGLTLAEQAPGQLTDPGPMHARVHRAGDRVLVRYPVRARARGRWWLGPLLATRTDVLGLARGRSPLGARTPVAVWPAVVALATPGDALIGESDQAAPGVRSPSPDDAALRDYRVGDDLRRVHWTSTARRGQVMVRADEHSGMRPVTVLVGLPVRAAELDWTLSLAASMAIAALAEGHRVRLLGTGTHLTPPEHRPDGPHARATLLDPLIDLQAAGSAEESSRLLREGSDAVGSRTGEIVLAVIGPGPSGDAAGTDDGDGLDRLADRARCWAIVREPAGSDTTARATAERLRRAGWRATTARPGEDLQECWLRMRASR